LLGSTPDALSPVVMCCRGENMILTASLLEDSEYLPKIHSLDEIFNKIPVSTFHYVLLVITGFSFMAQAIVNPLSPFSCNFIPIRYL
jgi:hypothetical protein